MDNIARFLICIIVVPIVYAAVTSRIFSDMNANTLLMQINFGFIMGFLSYFVVRKKSE